MKTNANVAYTDEGDSRGAFPLFMNARVDSNSQRSQKIRGKDRIRHKKTGQSLMEFSPTHEMGHMLNYLLVKERYRAMKDKKFQQIDPKTGERISRGQAIVNALKMHSTADELVDQVLKETMPEEEYKKIVRYQDDQDKADAKNPAHKSGQINFRLSKLGETGKNRGYTTQYASTAAVEFFANAFEDVYQNGKSARKTSKKLVQLYKQKMKDYKEENKRKLGED